MRRRAGTIAAGLSLVLCAASAGMWVRSLFVSEMLAVDVTADRQATVGSEYGACWASGAVVRPPAGAPVLLPFREGYHGAPTVGRDVIGWFERSFAGFAHVSQANRVVNYQAFTVPYWFLCTLLAAWPALWLVRRRRERARAAAAFPVRMVS